MRLFQLLAAGVAAAAVSMAGPAAARDAALNKAAAPKPELAKAVASQNDAKIQKLLAAGAPLDVVDSKGQTALLYAVQQGNAALIQQLVDKGAMVDFRGEDGATPLGVALRNPATTLETVQLLLARGANADIPDKTGRTPLMQAVLRSPLILDFDSQAAIVRALLAAGADPNRRDDAGFSALHYAAQVGEPRQQLQLLLETAKDANAASSKGANVLMMAVMGGQRPTVDYLIAKGFRPVTVTARAVTEIKDPLTHDPAPRATALGYDWYGQYVARTGDAAGAEAAYAVAAPAYDAAIAEAKRAMAAYETSLSMNQRSGARRRRPQRSPTSLSCWAAARARPTSTITCCNSPRASKPTSGPSRPQGADGGDGGPGGRAPRQTDDQLSGGIAMKTTMGAAAILAAMGIAGSAHAAVGVLVTGQALKLPLGDAAEAPVLKVVVAKATLEGLYYWERPADRKARANQVVLNSVEGRALVTFVRHTADQFRARAVAEQPPKPTTLSLTFADKVKVDNGALMGDALKESFTLGAATSATQAETFVTHMELTLDLGDGAPRTYACDAQEGGRVPKGLQPADTPPDTAEHERMYDVARRACLAQVLAQIDGKAAPAAAMLTRGEEPEKAARGR